jgi:NosR/NirI family nitrous oxide reductase transcriptional regulator
MSLTRAIAFALLACGTLAAAAGAQFRFPMPEFESGYRHPDMNTPLPVKPAPALDIAILTGALALTAWLVIKRRSRREVFLLAVFSLIYFGFYRKGCVCSVGSLQNVLYGYLDRSFEVPAVVVAFFFLPLLFALYFGRVFCAAVCPLGAVQDLSLLKPVKLPTGLTQALSLLPYLYLTLAVLYAALGTSFLVCEYDPFVAFFRRDGTYNMLIFGGSLLVIGLFVGRPYCRFLCPYGVLLRWLAPLAKWRVKVHPETCIQCRLCEESCPFEAIQPPTPEPDPARRREGRRLLTALLFLFPVLILTGAWLGFRGGDVLAQMDFTVRLAERVWAEEQGTVQDTADESDAFRKQARPVEELYAEAEVLKERFRTGGAFAFGFIGLVIGWKLIRHTLRRRRTVYEADPGVCLSCARCYLACPGEHARLGLVGEKAKT